MMATKDSESGKRRIYSRKVYVAKSGKSQTYRRLLGDVEIRNAVEKGKEERC